jgi:hypothetical protein
LGIILLLPAAAAAQQAIPWPNNLPVVGPFSFEENGIGHKGEVQIPN